MLLLLTQQLAELPRERQPEDFFDGTVLAMSKIVFAAPRGASHVDPVRRPVTGSPEAIRIDERLREPDRVSIQTLPIARQHSCHATENVSSQVRYSNPRQYQKASVVGDESDIALARLLIPADKTIPAAQMPWRRTPSHTGDRPSVGPHQILEMLAHRLLVAQIVVVLDEAVEQGLVGGAAHLHNLDWTQLPQRSHYGGRIDQHRRRPLALGQRIRHCETDGGKFDLTGPVQHQQQAAAHHIAQGSVGLSPIPGFAEFGRQPSSTQAGVFGDELTEERYILLVDDSATVAIRDRHAISVPEFNLERKRFVLFYVSAQALTRRHSGAASISGFPAAISNCAWCALSTRAGSSPVGHQRNFPFERRFVASQNPWPSYVNNLMAVPRRLRKMT